MKRLMAWCVPDSAIWSWRDYDRVTDEWRAVLRWQIAHIKKLVEGMPR